MNLAAANAAAGKDSGPGVGEMVAAIVVGDPRLPAEFAAPHYERRIQHTAAAEVFHQGRPRRVEDFRKPADRFEVILVSVPPEVVADERAQGHLDKWHSAFDKPTGQQAALAKDIPPIRIAERGRLFLEIERCPRGGPHEPHRAIVGRLVTQRRKTRIAAHEVSFHFLQQIDPCVDLLSAHAVRGVEILHAHGLLISVLPLLLELIAIIGNQQGSVLWSQESRAPRRLTEESIGRDADEIWQRMVFLAQFLGKQRTEGRVLDRALGQIAGAQVKRAARGRLRACSSSG